MSHVLLNAGRPILSAARPSLLSTHHAGSDVVGVKSKPYWRVASVILQTTQKVSTGEFRTGPYITLSLSIPLTPNPPCAGLIVESFLTASLLCAGAIQRRVPYKDPHFVGKSAQE